MSRVSLHIKKYYSSEGGLREEFKNIRCENVWDEFVYVLLYIKPLVA